MLAGLVGVALVCPSGTLLAAGKVRASTGELVIPTYPWGSTGHPYFRGTDRVNIYPYPMLDFLSRERTNRTYRTVILENDFLRITFLPELGGRIHEVIDKTTGRPMFYVNHVIKPGLIGQCGAWISGGVEWNTGPQGHTVSCMQPVAVRILPRSSDGSQSVTIGETERIYGTKWTVVVTLRPDRSFIEERIRIYNPTTFVRPYYFWNCTAAPNTPGFRFIYPMTLGCDHAGETFFKWPVDNGKDLSRGTNYQDASSIFAWHCDQDFFGSYNDDLDHGAVSYANHHQLPGKKAWTWGQGGFGRMHQMDLTDNDGPYNEVQTGPLLTQAQVGRLDPCEAVEWNEWWYPIHGLGGFTFANKNVAVNAERHGATLSLRMLGTAVWNPVQVRVRELSGAEAERLQCRLSPRVAAQVNLVLPESEKPVDVELLSGTTVLASFTVPLTLPVRTPPEKQSSPDEAPDLVRAGWDDYLFARYQEAETKFRRALEKDPRLADAHTGLALLELARDPDGASHEAELALGLDSGSGLAHLVQGTALLDRDQSAALEAAWKAALDPATAVAGRALVAQILIRQHRWNEAITALAPAGPWREDPLCRGRLALAHFMSGDKKDATQIAQGTLDVDPLDVLANGVLWLAKPSKGGRAALIASGREAEDVLELAAQLVALKQNDLAAKVITGLYLDQVSPEQRQPVVRYWASYLLNSSAKVRTDDSRPVSPNANYSLSEVYPHRLEDVAVLEAAAERDPNNGQAALDLGHVLFHLGRDADARAMWKRAAQAGAQPAVACRALGMAAKTLDNNLDEARSWLEKANQVQPDDAIVARDLAGVLFALADKAVSDADKQAFVTHARDSLKGAFEAGKTRSDFVALLARAHTRLGENMETVRMLDTVRVTVWEGSHEVHDLFEQAHLALGEAQLKASRPAEALREFDRALEYPANLATGKLENARQAHIQYQRGLALSALGRKEEARAAWQLAAAEPESNVSNIEAARQKAKDALAAP
jgi:tetratricopeptide (TPR) repeat protein